MIRTETEREATSPPNGGVIRIGFVPLCDCAPVVMAHELRLFEAHGLRVELSREVGWATIRDKIVMRELEAAHAPAALVLGISLGIGSFKVPCCTGLVLNLNGNAVTLSKRLSNDGIRDAATLCEFVRSRRSVSSPTFGVAFSCSSHNFLLQKWLREGGLEPGHDVNIVVVPPPQMPANLKAGNLDGYCVGEPWNSLAVIQGAGWIAALSPDISPRHPEKVLLVRSEFADSRADEHERLIAALIESCEFCQSPKNREQVIETIAGSNYLDTDPEAIQSSLSGPFKYRSDDFKPCPDLHLFAGPEVNEPGLDKAVWTRQSLFETGLLPKSTQLGSQRLAAMFRGDVFRTAARRTSSNRDRSHLVAS